MTVLLREAIGDRLRRTRTSQSRTLRDVSRQARVSLGYLSEVERGRKEPSSELLASICDALDLPLDELLIRVATDVRPAGLPEVSEVPDTVPDELVDAATPAEPGQHVVLSPEEALPTFWPAGPDGGGPTVRAMAGAAA